MSGTEWQNSVNHSYDLRPRARPVGQATLDNGRETMDELWQRKEAEARSPASDDIRAPHGAGTYDSIKEHGYQRSREQVFGNVGDHPSIGFRYGKTIQLEGHHRVASAAALERETGKPVWIPTNYVRA